MEFLEDNEDELTNDSEVLKSKLRVATNQNHMQI